MRMSLRCLWIYFVLTTFALASPVTYKKHQTQILKSDVNQLQHSNQAFARSRHPFLSGTAEYEDYTWFHPMVESHKLPKHIDEPNLKYFEDQLPLMDQLKMTGSILNHKQNVKRSDYGLFNFFSRKKEAKMNQFARRNERNWSVKNQKKSALEASKLPDDKGMIVCKEVPYNICFRIDKDGKMHPLSQTDEPRPVRILRVY